MEQNFKCVFCQSEISPAAFFCPVCGKKVRETPLSASLVKQVGIYLVSFFLPPLGLIPALKYLRQGNPKLKNIGLIAVALTVFSILISVYLAVSISNELNRQVQEQLQNLPF